MKLELRKNQKEIISKIMEYFRGGTKVVILNAPTGVGKSIINMIVTKQIGSGYTTTPLRTLVDQYKNTLIDFHEEELGWVIKGKGSYPCPYLLDRDTKKLNLLPIEERENIYKKHEQHLKELTADSGPCNDGKPKYYVGIGNGNRGKEKEYVDSCPFIGKCLYYYDKDKAMDSDNTISTFDYFMYGIYKQLKKKEDKEKEKEEEKDSNEKYEREWNIYERGWDIRQLLTIDEAHSLPSKLTDFFTITISDRSLPDFNIKLMKERIEEEKKRTLVQMKIYP